MGRRAHRRTSPGTACSTGRTAVVTAAAGAGIGGATARRFLEEGARVVISDAHARRLKEYEARARRGVRRATVSPRCPATSPTRTRCGPSSTTPTRPHGRLDIVVNNAGLGGTADLVDMTDEQWSQGPRRHAERHLPLHPRRPALACRPPARGGVIVNNASVVGWRAQAGQAHYAAAKAGVMALTRCAAARGRRVRGTGQRRRPEPRHAPAPGEGHHPRTAGRTDRAGGLRPVRRALGGRQRDRLPGAAATPRT